MPENTVEVRYRVCVYATVDLDSGHVTRVVIDDESARLDYQAPEGTVFPEDPNNVVDADLGGLVDEQAARRAIHIAENGPLGWPQWDLA